MEGTLNRSAATIRAQSFLKAKAKPIAIAGASMVTIANIGSFLSDLEKIQAFVLNLLGLYNSYIVHFWFKIVLVLFMGVGYIILSGWIYLSYFFRRAAHHQAIFGALAVFIGIFVGYLNYRIVGVGPTVSGPILRNAIEPLSETIFRQADGKGFNPWSGGVAGEPQVWTTAQCLVAVLKAAKLPNIPVRQNMFSAKAGALKTAFDYIELSRLTNSKSLGCECGQAGIAPKAPIQPGGWGYVDASNWGVTEIAGWVVLAKLAGLDHPSVREIWSEVESKNILDSVDKDLSEIVERQHDDGGWAPIPKTADHTHLRTYSSAIALWALIEARRFAPDTLGVKYSTNIDRGLQWLINTYGSFGDGSAGWFPNPSKRPSAERFAGLTAQVLYIMTEAEASSTWLKQNFQYVKMKSDFVERSASSDHPASLRHRSVAMNDRVHDSDRYLRGVPYTVESSTFLWYPWSLALTGVLRSDPALTEAVQEKASNLFNFLVQRMNTMLEFIQGDPVIYPTAEFLIALSSILSGPDSLEKRRKL